MSSAKFRIGDKVVVNKRTPLYVLYGIRHNRARTVTEVCYDPVKQCRYFHLGDNYRGKRTQVDSYPFRSYQLDRAVHKKAGRPRLKRKYQRQAVLNTGSIPGQPKRGVLLPTLI